MKNFKQSLYSLLVLILLLCCASLFAVELVYEPASGKTYGFDLSRSDRPDTPSSYTTTPDIWHTKAEGFVGRIRYQGPPTRLTFTETEHFATGTANNMFYFTYLTGGFSQVYIRREFFLVTTAKGLFHNGKQDEFIGYNTPIYENGGGVSIPVSSGPETWGFYETGKPGYSSYGCSETKTWSSNLFAYKHKYQYIWVDMVVIRCDQIRPTPLSNGTYLTRFIARTSEGLSLPFELFGENNPSGPNDTFLFKVESVVPRFFPYETLRNKNTVPQALHVGNLSYYSLSSSANLRTASDAAGSEATFRLYSGGVPPIPFDVVFRGTTPQGPPKHIRSPYEKFQYISTNKKSPIDGQTSVANVLEGKLSIFVPANTLPMSGSYTGNIYCIITQQP